MTGLIIIVTFILLAIIVVQLGKVTELSAKIRGEERAAQQANDRTALWLLLFMIGFLIFCGVITAYYKNQMLGYGPHTSASAHGVEIDSLFHVTLILTGIVFVLTHIYLFWFAYKYRAKKGRKALFFPHNNTLEFVWTAVPSVFLIYLVVKGLIVWNDVMPDVGPDEEYIEIEATGYQYAWALRYPGPDGVLGTKHFRNIDLATNPVGQDWEDEKNLDDFHTSDVFYLPVNKKVRVRITARDVLHNFYLPHFRVKMDAIPGLPTYFIFTPTTTTAEYRERLREYPEWQVPADLENPNGPQKWEAFDYELACAELCGMGHYSMKKTLRIVSEEEYEDWLATNTSYYMQNIRNTGDDPFKGELLDTEIKNRTRQMSVEVASAITTETTDDDLIRLEHVFFDTGSATLKEMSRFELNNWVSILNNNPSVDIEFGGHTDSTGDDGANMDLSKARAESVTNYLVNKGISSSRLRAVGFGEDRPVGDNSTEEGRQMNRRTEARLLK